MNKYFLSLLELREKKEKYQKEKRNAWPSCRAAIEQMFPATAHTHIHRASSFHYVRGGTFKCPAVDNTQQQHPKDIQAHIHNPAERLGKPKHFVDTLEREEKKIK